MRNFKDDKYKEWRKAVRKRDGHKCLKCLSKKKLEVHHIRKWSSYPTLRYLISNGITLCRNCHQKLWGNEETYAAVCLSLIRNNRI